MRMEIHQRGITCKVVIRGVNTEVGISDGGARHVQRINNLLKIRRRAIRRDLIGENDEELDGGRKAKRTAYLTKRNQQIT